MHMFSLKEPVPGISAASVNVKLNRNLLSPDQREKLNPMAISVVSAENMPDNPTTFAKLRELYQPV